MKSNVKLFEENKEIRGIFLFTGNVRPNGHTIEHEVVELR